MTPVCTGCHRSSVKVVARGLCATCKRRNPPAAKPELPPLDADGLAFLAPLLPRLIRYGRKIGHGKGLRGMYLDDCSSEVVLGAIEAVVKNYIRHPAIIFAQGKYRLFHAFQSGAIPANMAEPTATEKSKTGRRMKGKELLFSEVLDNRDGTGRSWGEVELIGRIVA